MNLGMGEDYRDLFERLVIGALMVDQLSESESEALLLMEGKPDMLEPFQALEVVLKRNAILKRLHKGAEMIESATNETDLIKYKRLYDAIEIKYSEVNQLCKHYEM